MCSLYLEGCAFHQGTADRNRTYKAALSDREHREYIQFQVSDCVRDFFFLRKMIDMTVRPNNPASTRIREKLMSEMVRGELEDVFGPGVMHKSDNGRIRLEFHPV